MNRAVYVGGFGENCQPVAEAIAETLNYDEVTPITFAAAMMRPELTLKAVRDTHTYCHREGLVAISQGRPSLVEAFNPPIRTPIHGLGRACLARLREPSSTNNPGKTALELAAYLCQLPTISRFCGINAALEAKAAGINIGLHYTEGYFTPTSLQRTTAERHHIPITNQPGLPDELVLRPATTLRRAFDFDS